VIPAVVELVRQLDALKAVTRKTKNLFDGRYENSAEHSWQIAMLAWGLAPIAPAGVQINRVIQMLLLHDIGEIDTGDTIVYAETGWDERKAQEEACVRRLFNHLPQGAQFVELWLEFEAGTSVDAKFAHAADRAMPVLLNLANRGQSWVENGITFDRVVGRIRQPIEQGCPQLWQYLETELIAAQQQGWFGTLSDKEL
jgi:putative hydrolase of HD superfamily